MMNNQAGYYMNEQVRKPGKPRVLFAIPSLAGGGAEKLLNDLIPMLNNGQYECELVILSDRNEKYLESLKASGIKITVMPPTIKSHWESFRYLRKLIRGGNYDIVHANLFPVLYYCALAKLFGGGRARLVMTEHSTNNRRRHIPLLRPIEKLVYRQYSYVISISQQTQNMLLKWLKPSPRRLKRFVVVNNGVPLARFIAASAYPRNQLVATIRESDVLLCMVGTFSRQKNHLFMIDVMKKLPDNYILLLVGEGKLLDSVKERVEEQGLEERVVFLGFRKDVAEILHTIDISVIPSLWEGFGLVAIEAMACGKPIVITDVPGLSDAVGDYALKAGLNDADTFASQILRLQDSDAFSEYCSKSRERALIYDIEKMKLGYQKIYENVMNAAVKADSDT